MPDLLSVAKVGACKWQDFRARALRRALSPWPWLLLRATAGLVLLPHALQKLFGFSFLKAKCRQISASWQLRSRIGAIGRGVLGAHRCRDGVDAGPLLALGLCTRLAALPIFIFLALSAAAHGKRDGYCWTVRGAEYPLVGAMIALFFLINGGGAFSLDRAFGVDL